MATTPKKARVRIDAAPTTEISTAPPADAEKATSPTLSLRPGEVIGIVPKGGITLTRDDGQQVRYNEGTVPMLRADAEHWFAKNLGVKIFGA